MNQNKETKSQSSLKLGEDVTSKFLHSIYNDVIKGIELTFESKCCGSCLALIYSAIDAMATIIRPGDHLNVKKEDFINWIDYYVKFPGREMISGEEFYSARCAIVHNFGVESQLTRDKKARMIGYMVGGSPAVKFSDKCDTLVMLEIGTLKKAVIDGIKQFVIDIIDPGKFRSIDKDIIYKRLGKYLTSYTNNDENYKNISASISKPIPQIRLWIIIN